VVSHGPVEDVLTCFNSDMAGVGAFTRSEAEAVFPVPAVVEVTVTELFLSPAVVPVTFTEIVQDAFAARLNPLKLTVELPATAVMVPPPQVVDWPLGLATTNPAGRLSVNATPLKAVPVFGLVTAKFRTVVPLVRMDERPKALVITGGTAVTVRSAAP
jgi:hypothetical protein